MVLMGEVDNLRKELQQTREKLEEVERTADQDQLLPLLNRRAFVRELTRYIAFTGRYGTPATLIYFDLDGFKQVNDTFGHAGGDAVLSHFAQTLQADPPNSDVVGRLGGDEFGVLLFTPRKNRASKKRISWPTICELRRRSGTVRRFPTAFSYGAFELKTRRHGRDRHGPRRRGDVCAKAQRPLTTPEYRNLGSKR